MTSTPWKTIRWKYNGLTIWVQLIISTISFLGIRDYKLTIGKKRGNKH